MGYLATPKGRARMGWKRQTLWFHSPKYWGFEWLISGIHWTTDDYRNEL